MTIPELEEALRKAQEQAHAALTRLPPAEYVAVHRRVLDAERALARAKGEPHAVPVDFPARWSPGAPMPHMLRSDYRTFLVFLVQDVPDWNDPSTLEHRGDQSAENLAIVEFEGCICAKMGTPNDEVWSGHPLYGKGFDGYAAMVVENSLWLKELETINSVHPQYKPERWRERTHYILPFHDSTFECVAKRFKVETRDANLHQLLGELCERLISR